MKYLILILIWLPCSICLQAQKMSCCAPSATEAFAQFASDKNFVMSHLEPRPFHYQSENGKAIVFKAADGSDAFGWEIKSRKATNNYLLVFHEWWGLNDYIKKESETMWNDLGNINVIDVDLYDGKVATTREDAVKLVQAVTTERAKSIIQGAMNYAGAKAKIFTVGWCFGGGWSLQAALIAGAQAAGCIIYYGMPEKDLSRLEALHGDVLGIFANRDQNITPAIVDAFAGNMKKAGKKLMLYRYDAVHAFANPSNPGFDKAARDDAYKHSIDFLKERLH